MEIISTISTARGLDEEELVNRYTYRQLLHIGGTLLKERMLVLTALSGAFKSGKKTDKRFPPAPRTKKELPKWFVPKASNYRVVDLDGPLDELRNEVNYAFTGKMK